jgi:hypothetical protein
VYLDKQLVGVVESNLQFGVRNFALIAQLQNKRRH